MMRRALRGGRLLLDGQFDELYPPAVREVSSSFWTPVSVAMRVAELLVRGPRTRVLDVGSGVGKFCIVGAAVTGATFVGLEHREHFVRVAEGVARRLGVRNATFVHGRLGEHFDTRFDAYYFYNPFEENLWGGAMPLDQTVELSERRFFDDVETASAMLSMARVGTRVATYHGFGGVMPNQYRRIHREPAMTDHIELWIKSEGPASARTSNRTR
ncbi:class I SAM-dependent methyltransferase [Pendulispora brunnea]|uniref:Class I SAM-dependent methyltransferase n=1 Tax=Pendulispora brunnea TaxID=2905690 RepID=A0ABZ2JYX9_9BACT